MNREGTSTSTPAVENASSSPVRVGADTDESVIVLLKELMIRYSGGYRPDEFRQVIEPFEQQH